MLGPRDILGSNLLDLLDLVLEATLTVEVSMLVVFVVHKTKNDDEDIRNDELRDSLLTLSDNDTNIASNSLTNSVNVGLLDGDSCQHFNMISYLGNKHLKTAV